MRLLSIRELEELFSYKFGIEIKEEANNKEIQYCHKSNIEDNPLIKLRKEGRIKCIISKTNN